MQQYKIVLGLEITESIVRAAEVEHRGDKFFLSRVAERQIQSHSAEDFTKALSSLLDEDSFLAKTVSAAVDTTMVEKDTIDVDSALNSTEVLSFIRAEVLVHNGLPEIEYSAAYQLMKKHDEGYSEIFYAAIRKDLLGSLRDSCRSCALDLRFVDIDQSCSEGAVNWLAPCKSYILATVKEKQVEAGFCKNGERTVYRFSNFSGEPVYAVKDLVEEVESLTGEPATKIYLCGRGADQPMADLLRANVDERYAIFEPTRSLMLSPLARADERLQSNSPRYSAVIGAALK